MNNDIEDRLRHLLPLLADAIVNSEPTRPVAPLESSEPSNLGASNIALTPVDHRNATEARSGSRRRLLSVAAAAMLVVGGAVATAMIGLRDEPGTDRPQSAEPPAQASATSERPAWFTAIANQLPEGFTRLGITDSNELYVSFEAFNPSTSHGLDITISRGPMTPDPDGAVPIEEARNGDWGDRSPNDLNVSLDDGRQLGVGCMTMTLDEPDCAPINGRVVDPDQLRLLLVALATDLPPTDLPEATDVLDHITSGQIDLAVDLAIDLEKQYEVSLPHLAFSFAAYGAGEEAPTQVHVRTVTGLVATAADQTLNGGQVELPDRRIAWSTMNDGTIWTVTTDPDMDAAIGRQILDAARLVGPVPLLCLFDDFDQFQIGPLAADSLITRLEQALIDGTTSDATVTKPAINCSSPMTVEQVNNLLDYLRTL